MRQLWYLGDALLYGTPHEVVRALDILLVALRHIDLEINFTKCELYSDGTCALPESLRRVPLVPDVSKWSYLGSSLANGDSQSAIIAATSLRASAVVSGITALAEKIPYESLQLLRFTAGACRLEHACKTTA